MGQRPGCVGGDPYPRCQTIHGEGRPGEIQDSGMGEEAGPARIRPDEAIRRLSSGLKRPKSLLYDPRHSAGEALCRILLGERINYKMKLGIILYSSDPETVWNGFRFGNFALQQGDTVKVFLLAKGVECERLDTEQFKVTEQMRTFIKGGGRILACGTCLNLRQSKGTEMCPVSTMKDLYEMVKESDKTVTF